MLLTELYYKISLIHSCDGLRYSVSYLHYILLQDKGKVSQKYQYHIS